MWLLIGLASIVTIVALLQRPLAWVGMYFRLKHELPEHALVDATYLNLPTGFGGRRRSG